jgi:lipopolysaccharide transport system permease protein
MRTFSTHPWEMAQSLYKNRQLIIQMGKREAIGRYRGSAMGIAWSFFNPILMLTIYTVVFSGVFNARWGINPNETKVDFAITLFMGLIIHGIFAECINKAPSLITANPNYVKKVIFPLESLSWISLSSALFHAAVSLSVLAAAQIAFHKFIPFSAILLPLVILPLILGTLGLSWLLASLGVYLRDVTQVTGMFTTMMLFGSAVFFPISALPDRYQFWLQINPLAVIIEQSRRVFIFGLQPEWPLLIWMYIIGLLLAWGGFAWFQKTRKGFADVI